LQVPTVFIIKKIPNIFEIGLIFIKYIKHKTNFLYDTVFFILHWNVCNICYDQCPIE